MTDMTQAPTPGPLSGDWPVVTDKWVETYCDLTGRDPDGGSVTFLGDGPVSTSFRDAARREIEAMLCAAPKSAIRSLAPTAPVEASGSDDPLREHVRAMQRMATAYLVPEDYTDRNGDVTFHGTDTNSREYKYDQAGRRAKAFANDMIYMLDGPEERAAMSAPRPQPSGETRKALDRLKMAAHVYEDDEMAADCATLEALLSARPAPVALGGQHSSGEATWHPLDDEGLAEVRVNGKRITSMPSYDGAKEVAQRINDALSATPVAETAGEADDD